MQIEPRDTARDFAVHPPRKLQALRVFEPLEDQIHEDTEPKVLMYRVAIKEFNEWEAEILKKYGWEILTDNAKSFLNGTSQNHS